MVASFGDVEEKKFKDCSYLNVRDRGLSVLVTRIPLDELFCQIFEI